MRTITIIYDGTLYTYSWLKAMLCSKAEFKKEGYEVKLTSFEDYYPIDTKLEERIKKRSLANDYDIVFLAFHHSLGWLGKCSSIERADYLKKIKARCNKLIWLDTADSTGSCIFDVLPFVDRYLKKQILGDTTEYTRPMYQNRIFSDYYHQKLYINDEIVEDSRASLDKAFADKLGVAWNLCLGDIFRRLRYVLIDTFHVYTPSFSSNCYNERKFEIHFRGSLNYSNTIGYQRKKIAERLRKYNDLKRPDPFKRVSRNIFYKELSSSKAILSPFGWGEVCFRDFEAFCYGATLIKPSMSGIITYPNLYIENETYIPLDWDLSNFEQIIDDLNSERYMVIAKNGQELFKKYISNEGKMDFVRHIVEEIKSCE